MQERIALSPTTRALSLAPRAVPAARSLPPLNQLFLTLVRAVGNGNSCELFELEGRLDQEILRRAIACALRRHPVLNSTLEKSWFRPSWRPAPRELPVDVRI